MPYSSNSIKSQFRLFRITHGLSERTDLKYQSQVLFLSPALSAFHVSAKDMLLSFVQLYFCNLFSCVLVPSVTVLIQKLLLEN